MRDTYLLVKSKFVRVRNSSEPESNVNVLDEFSSRGSEDGFCTSFIINGLESCFLQTEPFVE